MDVFELIVITCSFFSAVLVIFNCFSNSRSLPKKSVLAGFEGITTWAQVELNGFSLTVTLIINEEELAIKSHIPSIGIILKLSELVLIKEKSFIGSRIKIVSNDHYINHMFHGMIISNRVAKKLAVNSHGMVKL